MLIVTQESNKNFSFSIRILWKQLEVHARRKKQFLHKSALWWDWLKEKKNTKGKCNKTFNKQTLKTHKIFASVANFSRKKPDSEHESTKQVHAIRFHISIIIMIFILQNQTTVKNRKKRKKKLTSNGIYKRKNKRKIMILTRWFN